MNTLNGIFLILFSCTISNKYVFIVFISFIKIYCFAISIFYRYPSLTATAVAAARNAYNVGQGNKQEEEEENELLAR